MNSLPDQMIPQVPFRKTGAATFGVLFLLESLVRAINSGVLSIQAYDLLGSSRAVSILGTGVSLTVLLITLCMPFLFGRLRRRWAYTIGGLMLIGGSMALASFTLTGQITGVILRNSGASIMNVTLQLYIMDHIRKTELTRSEPLRLAVSTFCLGGRAYFWCLALYKFWPAIPAIRSHGSRVFGAMRVLVFEAT